MFANFVRCLTVAALAGIVLFVAGCESTGTSSNSKARAPLVVEKPLTALDKKELLAGAGAADKDPPAEFTKTASGLQYRILRKAEGKKPTLQDRVTVHYRGWLDDGTEFDSSYSRFEPTTFILGEVVPGWQEGLQLVNRGGMIELWIPAALGYGDRGQGGVIPPGATLHFIVELLEIKTFKFVPP